MPGILAVILIIPAIAYLLFAEFVARHCERRYQTDIEDAEANVLTDGSDSMAQTVESSTDEPPASNAWKGWRKMVVVSTHDESSDCRSFMLQPIDSGTLPRFLGGQSILVRIPVTNPLDSGNDARLVSRCYSLSSGPGEVGYRITVQRVPDGQFSTCLHDTINIGDELEIQAPRGRFHMDCDAPDRPLHLIAAGIGITPMLSMLLHSLEETSAREVHLYYQLRDESNAPFLRALRFLSDSLASTGRFGLHVWFSGPADNQTIGNRETIGRITADQIVSQISDINADADYRICGPVAFMESMAEGLIALGADPDCVQYESFGGKSKRPGAISVDSDDAAQMAPHEVTFAKSDKKAVFSDANDSLLEVAEATHVPVESSCRSGMCGSCVHHLIRGQVQYSDQPECEFGQDEVVMCVAKPVTDVVIDV